jgi:hypothetical protein
VFNHQAPVRDVRYPVRTRKGLRALGRDTDLRPDDRSLSSGLPSSDDVTDDILDESGPAKDVDQVDPALGREIDQRRVARQPEDRLVIRVDGHYIETLLQQVLECSVARSMRPRRASDQGDGVDPVQKPRDRPVTQEHALVSAHANTLSRLMGVARRPESSRVEVISILVHLQAPPTNADAEIVFNRGNTLGGASTYRQNTVTNRQTHGLSVF